MTKGQMEAAISRMMLEYQRNLVGRGPGQIHTYIVADMVQIRMQNVLTREETYLAQSERGKEIIKAIRQQLRTEAGPELVERLEDLTGCHVLTRHGDVSTRTGESLDVFIMDRDLEELLTEALPPAVPRRPGFLRH